MLKTLQKIVSSQQDERRKHKRHVKPFRVKFRRPAETEWIPAIAMDMSAGGLGALFGRHPGKGPFVASITLDPFHTFEVRVQPMSDLPGTHQGKAVRKVGFKFIGIGADDWDMVVRWTHGLPLHVESVAKAQIAEKNNVSEDDLLRLMPKKLLDEVLGKLVERRRLAPLDPRLDPLVSYEYHGEIRRGDYRIYRLTIDSKVIRGEEAVRYRTRVKINATTGEIEVS